MWPLAFNEVIVEQLFPTLVSSSHTGVTNAHSIIKIILLIALLGSLKLLQQVEATIITASVIDGY